MDNKTKFQTELKPKMQRAGIQFLTGQTYAKLSAGNKAVVLVFAQWCGACIRFDEEYIKFAKHIQDINKKYCKNFMVIAIDNDAPANEILKPIFQTTAYPSIYFVHPNGKPSEYTGSDDAESLFAAFEKEFIN